MDQENWEQDEIDEFANHRNELLLEKAGWNKKDKRNSDSEDEASDEEVLTVETARERYQKQLQGPIDEDEEEFFIDKEDSDDEGEKNENWGGKKDYYGAEDVEELSEEEDVKAMEEEALRLQKKHMEELNMGDYMLDEAEEEWSTTAKKDQDDKNSHIDETFDANDKLSLLKSNYPEYLPLVEELGILLPLKEKFESEEQTEVGQIKYKALCAYLSTIVCYLSLFQQRLQSNEKFSMKDESIMMGVLNNRELWRQAKGLSANATTMQDAPSLDEEEEEEEELAQLEESSSSSSSETEQTQDTDEEEQDSDGPSFAQVRKVRHLKQSGPDSLEQSEHVGRRKSLRFYTSKIDQRDRKRDMRFQGDDDLSYQETEWQKRERLSKLAQKRGQRQGPGEDLE